jgi:hypothetical protein
MDNNDGCNENCRFAPVITCNDPTAPADPLSCSAAIACDAIASCVDPDGGAVTVACDPGGPYGLGTTDVTVVCSDQETTTVVCHAIVEDATPPEILVALDPTELWPPNHRLIDVHADVIATDTCSTTTAVLESITSSEPDNAVGNGDGNTVNDIQEADIGTNDFDFLLRAERAGSGEGRVYTVSYTATDSTGNQTTAEATVLVPHDKDGITEPLIMTLEQTDNGTALRWTHATGSNSYNVIRGRLSDLVERDPAYDLGTVNCVEGASPNENTDGDEDAEIPAIGEVFIYFVEYDDGGRSAYGTVSAAKPRFPRAGDCASN